MINEKIKKMICIKKKKKNYIYKEKEIKRNKKKIFLKGKLLQII
jgi:hypothetical protein